jgi:hypothetical protein
MSVTNALRVGVWNALSAVSDMITALGGTAIYWAAPPDEAAAPYVVFSLQAGGPLNINANDLRDELVYVRAYSTSPVTAATLDGYCSVALHKQAITVSGYTNFWLVRETDVSLIETLPDGRRIYSEGAVYRVRLG